MNLEKFIESATPLRALAVTVIQDGKEIARHEWEPVLRRNVYSVSKSFTAAAVGIAAGEGLLSLDEKLVDIFPDELPEVVSDNLRKACVRDLLTMGIGHDQAWLMGAQRVQLTETDWVRLALSYPFVYEPDTTFAYNNAAPYLAAILVQRRAGCSLVDYLMPRLFEPLGILRPTWETDPMNNSFGASGLMLSVDEIARFGQLLLQDGLWNGRQLIPADWVRTCTSVQIDNGGEGYGYLFWRGPHDTWRADGMFGQFSIICRSKNAVIGVVAESREADKLLAAVFEDVYGQL